MKVLPVIAACLPVCVCFVLASAGSIKCVGGRRHVIVKGNTGRYCDCIMFFSSLLAVNTHTHARAHMQALTWECSLGLKRCHACHISSEKGPSVL